MEDAGRASDLQRSPTSTSTPMMSWGGGGRGSPGSSHPGHGLGVCAAEAGAGGALVHESEDDRLLSGGVVTVTVYRAERPQRKSYLPTQTYKYKYRYKYEYEYKSPEHQSHLPSRTAEFQSAEGATAGALYSYL